MMYFIIIFVNVVPKRFATIPFLTLRLVSLYVSSQRAISCHNKCFTTHVAFGTDANNVVLDQTPSGNSRLLIGIYIYVVIRFNHMATYASFKLK